MGLAEVLCDEVARANAYLRGDDGLLVVTKCPSEIACVLRIESYETRGLNMPEYFAYLLAVLIAEKAEV